METDGIIIYTNIFDESDALYNGVVTGDESNNFCISWRANDAAEGISIPPWCIAWGEKGGLTAIGGLQRSLRPCVIDVGGEERIYFYTMCREREHFQQSMSSIIVYRVWLPIILLLVN